MFGSSFTEFLMLMVIIFVLTSTGIWPQIMRALRELRGDEVPPEPGAAGYGARGGGVRAQDIELSYRLLGLSSNAPWDEVERAYRQKAKRHHPDLGGDEDAMRALNEAYALLKRARGR